MKGVLRRPRTSALLAWVMGLTVCAAMFVSPAAWASVDADGDFVADRWEQQWGFSSSDPTDVEADGDGDRLTGRDEYFAGSNPRTYTAISALSDRQLLDLFQGKTALFVWEQSRPPYFFTADDAHYDDPTQFSDQFNSLASTGFGLMALVIADEHDWVDHAAAYARARTLLARAVELQDPTYDRVGVSPTLQGNRHGYLYHFVTNAGTRAAGSEISSIDHALLVAGALVAGEYYQGTEVEQRARQLFLNTDWNWLYDGLYLAQGWMEAAGGSFEGGRITDLWNRYSELLILLVLAMGHPDATRAVPASAWDELTFGQGRMFPFEYAHLVPGIAPTNFGFVPNMPNTITAPGFANSATELHYLHAGSLHNHQYSHLFLDFRSRRDRYQTDFFANSISATMANRQFCIRLNETAFPDWSGDAQPYDTYGPDSWGLMAGLSSDGYKVLQPIIAPGDDFSPLNIRDNTDSGTVVLAAPLGSTPFTPRQTIDFLRNMLTRFQVRQTDYDALVGRYGFRNAFNIGRTATGQLGHFPTGIISLDVGPVIGSIENWQTGLIWRLAMRNAEIQRGLQAAGFPVGRVEPFIMNFDDNPPAPQEDPNGGGQDPHAFGGSTVAFGSATASYVWIGDPFPALSFGPQQWAQRISTTDNQDAGAFLTLNNHSISQGGRVSFWIRGIRGAEQFSVGLKDSVRDRLGQPLQATEVKLPIAPYHPDGAITADWKEVRIPLRDFSDRGVRLTELDNISFTNLQAGGGAIELDDLAFLGDEFAPQPPQGVIATVTGSGVSLTWQPSAEPDVVGYRVLRSRDGGVSFQALNSLLVVDPAFVDRSVVPGTYLYGVSAVDNARPANASAPSANTVQVVVAAAPTFNAVADQTVAEGQPLRVTVIASDADADLQTLTVGILPLGASFTLVGDLTGDGQWTQADVDALIPLLFRTPTAQELAVGDLDGDGRIAANDLTALTLVISNARRYGRFQWAPDMMQAGTYPITFAASDRQTTTPLTVTITVTPSPSGLQRPWQTGATGTLRTNVAWHYAMGYHFTPQRSGAITALGGFFNGTKVVKLFNKTTGVLLAQATVTAANTWAYAAIAPVTVQAGQSYTVAVYLAGSGGSYRSGLSPTLPRTVGDLRIDGSTYAATSTTPTARPTNTITTTMYGQADCAFAPTSTAAQTPWQSNATGTLMFNRAWSYAMGYHFTPQRSGQITALGGLFNGTKTVKLFNKATGQVLASATVTAANTWSYTPIPSISVQAGTTYTVAVYLAGTGGSARTNLSPLLPQTFGDIRIEGSTYASTSTTPAARPTNTLASPMYGQADVQFVPQ